MSMIEAETIQIQSNLDPSEGMSIIAHLGELRERIIKCIVAVAVGTLGCYFFIERIMQIIIASAGHLYYFSPAEAFFAYFKVALVTGLVVVLPILLYQVWEFLIPAFTSNEFHATMTFLPLSIALFYTGLAFAYFFVLPPAVQFFLGYSSEALLPMFSLGQYVSFVLGMVFPFGVVFELPLFMVVLAQIGLISSRSLTNKRKYVIVLSFLIGGVISPTPDIFGQTMLAIPIMVLYEASILVIRYLLHK